MPSGMSKNKDFLHIRVVLNIPSALPNTNAHGI